MIDCMIRRADFMVNRCLERKQLAIIIDRMMHYNFEVVERDAASSLCETSVFLCAVRRYSKYTARSFLQAPISNGQRLGVAGQIAPCVAHHTSFTSSTSTLIQNKL